MTRTSVGFDGGPNATGYYVPPYTDVPVAEAVLDLVRHVGELVHPTCLSLRSVGRLWPDHCTLDRGTIVHKTVTRL